MFKKIRTYFRRGWMIKLPSVDHTYLLLLKWFVDGHPFSFSGWGDREWEAVLGLKNETQANCDGHQYFVSMKEALHQILISDERYFFGMQKLACHKVSGHKIDAYLKQYAIKREWLNADAFHSASKKGNLPAFSDILSKKNVLLVGPSYLKRLKAFAFDFCEVPAKNCWLEWILEEIKGNISSKSYQVILFCSGMTSNWFVDQLDNCFPGFILDIGSLLNPYAGVNTRTYHYKIMLQPKF